MQNGENTNADKHLKELLNLIKPPPEVSPELDARVMASYAQTMAQIQVKSAQANINLRKIVAVSLVGVFAFSVVFTALLILLLGFELIKLPSDVIHTLLAATITQAVVLYRRVIADLFVSKGKEKAGPKKTNRRKINNKSGEAFASPLVGILDV